ncbi:hypothetical protein SCUP234_12535 [Seiridium cupressi]
MASLNHVASLIILLTTLVCATPAPAPEPSGLVTGLLSVVGNVGNAPTLLWTPDPSPECAAINQGELQCCRGALAGDQPLVVFLAEVYGYKLNPNDVNGINCEWAPVFIVGLAFFTGRYVCRGEHPCAAGVYTKTGSTTLIHIILQVTAS